MRKSGVLLAISSLPGKYGIGCFGKEAYDFVDFLVAAGQHYWQILPLGPTGFGDSPYQSFSTFAGNPYYIDLEELIKLGLLTKKECDRADLKDGDGSVNYEKIYFGKMPLLKKAFRRFNTADKEFIRFCRNEKEWLDDYALYMACKEEEGGASFLEWDADLRTRKPSAVKEAKKRLSDEVLYYSFLQYLFFSQWGKLKKYANEAGIEIIGDIPIYVAADSADTWANPKLFQLSKDFYPTAVAGCPPDMFAVTGQLWGNPLYDWDYHKSTGYAWWIQRIRHCFRLYDVVRVDHFRGFDSYYSIPYKDPTAEFGHWVKGPGFDLFRTVRSELGDLRIIAEDLGFLTPSVYKLMKKCGYPGMKILEFAFDGNAENEYLPYNYSSNCVVYTGTHDNETVQGWYASMKPADRKRIKEFLNVKSAKNLHTEMIRLAFASVADTAVVPMQDLLGYGNETRMNTPSTMGINWMWRMKADALSKELADNLYQMTKIYGRL